MIPLKISLVEEDSTQLIMIDQVVLFLRMILRLKKSQTKAASYEMKNVIF